MTLPPDTQRSRPATNGAARSTGEELNPTVAHIDGEPRYGGSLLRRRLDETAAELGCSMKSITVLAPGNDPFRVDTAARHRDGAWLATTARELGLGARRIHLRGLHYMVIGRPKPDGTPYANTEKDWLWLSEDAGKAARWLGYLDFDQIVDQRNGAPVVRIFTPQTSRPYISTRVNVDIPDVSDIEPYVGAYYPVGGGETRGGFQPVQPYKLVMIGEKSSLDDVLAPIANTHQSDLYLPTGEPSDTMLHQMARIGAEDGRPMVVLYFSDADPSGWQMPVSVARKLQAFQTALFPDLEFEVHRVALTPDQVREYGLPSTPLKDTERRGDNWRAAMGVEQTEIDALASLRPDLLRTIARDAIAPFYDSTLNRRVSSAYADWRERAQAVLDAATDTETLERIRTEAAEKLDALRDEIDAINDALRIDPGDVELPPIEVPAADLNGAVHPLPLLDSGWSFAEQCKALIDSKSYRNGGA